MIIAADIGGTKSLFGWFELDRDGEPLLKYSRQYPSADYSCLEDMIDVFLFDLTCEIPEAAVLLNTGGEDMKVISSCFSIAGTVIDNKCSPINLGWEVSVDGLTESFPQIGKIMLMNDLEATGIGIDCLKGKDLIRLTKVEGQKNKLKAIVAPGTGLGEALTFNDKIFASEGGHCEFGPRNEKEAELWAYLHNIYGHVSYERILSGPGLCNLLRFVEKRNGKKICSETVLPEDVTYRALSKNNRDENAVEALDLFVRILGAEAGNLALKTIPMGGLYLGGGIPHRILSRLKEDDFLEAFCDKGRFYDLMKKIPVYVICNDQSALLGSAQMAAHNF